MFNFNRVVRYFMLADLIAMSGWGLIDPIFAVFLIKDIPGASLLSIGFLSTIYWVAKALFQPPISVFLGKTDGERDDFYAAIFGLMIIGCAAFGLMVATKMSHIYFIQFIKAVGFSFYVPAWAAIFSRHLDKNHTAFEWAIQNTLSGLGIGLAGAVGASIANSAGFNFVFLSVGLMAILGAGLLLFVPDLILPRKVNPNLKLGRRITANLK